MKKILFSILIMMSCANIYATIGEPDQEISEQKTSLLTHARALEMNRYFPTNIFVENKTFISWKEITATFGITWTNTANESTQGSCNVTFADLVCKKGNGLVIFPKRRIFESAIRAFSAQFSQEQEQGLPGGIVSIQSVLFKVKGGDLDNVVQGRCLNEKTQKTPFTFDYNNFEILYTLKEASFNLVVAVPENN